MPKASPFIYWALELPYLILAALIVLLLARLLLATVAGHDSAIGRALTAITHPITASVGAVTPRIVPPAGVVACAVAWLVAARIILSMVAGAFGLRLWG